MCATAFPAITTQSAHSLVCIKVFYSCQCSSVRFVLPLHAIVRWYELVHRRNTYVQREEIAPTRPQYFTLWIADWNDSKLQSPLLYRTAKLQGANWKSESDDFFTWRRKIENEIAVRAYIRIYQFISPP